MSAIRRVVEVAVFAPLRQTYTYYADATVSGGEALAGRRVRVPFGRGERIGVVLQCGDVPANPKPVLKRVHEFIDEQPLLDPLQLKLCEWASD